MIKAMEDNLLEVASAIVMALAAGMVALWKTNQMTMSQRIEHAEQKLDECEANHKEANATLIKLSERVGNLEGAANRLRSVDD